MKADLTDICNALAEEDGVLPDSLRQRLRNKEAQAQGTSPLVLPQTEGVRRSLTQRGFQLCTACGALLFPDAKTPPLYRPLGEPETNSIPTRNNLIMNVGQKGTKLPSAWQILGAPLAYGLKKLDDTRLQWQGERAQTQQVNEQARIGEFGKALEKLIPYTQDMTDAGWRTDWYTVSCWNPQCPQRGQKTWRRVPGFEWFQQKKDKPLPPGQGRTSATTEADLHKEFPMETDVLPERCEGCGYPLGANPICPRCKECHYE